MKQRTKNISTAAIKDAIATAYGPHSLNALPAWGYGFCVESKQSKTVAWGEFLYDADDKFDGVINYNGDVLVDIASGETIGLKAAFAKGMKQNAMNKLIAAEQAVDILFNALDNELRGLIASKHAARAALTHLHTVIATMRMIDDEIAADLA